MRTFQEILGEIDYNLYRIEQDSNAFAIKEFGEKKAKDVFEMTVEEYKRELAYLEYLRVIYAVRLADFIKGKK